MSLVLELLHQGSVSLVEPSMVEELRTILTHLKVKVFFCIQHLQVGLVELAINSVWAINIEKVSEYCGFNLDQKV
jgi:hypothetical protein